MAGRTSRWSALAALAVAAACTDVAPTSPSVSTAHPLRNLSDPTTSATRQFCSSDLIRVPALASTTGAGPADIFPSAVQVAGIGTAAVKVTATIRSLTHSFAADIDMMLVGPTGVAVMLMSDAAGDNNFMSTTLTFDDDASSFVTTNPSGVIPSGTYKPTYVGTDDVLPGAPPGPYRALLSAFNGTDPNGPWQLYVWDDATSDVGVIAEGWCVTIASSGGNAAPTASSGGPYAAGEASPISFDGSASSDTDGEIVSYAWDFGDGETGAGPTPQHTYADNGTYSVTLTVTDNAGATSQATTTASVTNVAPRVSQITLPANPVAVGTPIVIGATFTDVGTADTHAATFDLGNGGTASGIVVESNGSGSATATVTYTQPGVYTVRASVTDDDGGTGTRSSALDLPAYIVVYDPSAGFVTGGGWIASPPGAYPANPSLTGRATFGFVAKAVSGTAPLGNTKFHLQVGSLDFSSTTYEWLVVANMKARFKGTGTINGAGGYGFLLTAVDGAGEGGVGDKLRVKIWNLATGSVVYDNDMGAIEDFTATTPLAGGSIVVHK